MCVYGFVFVRTDVCYFIMDILFIQWKLANQTLRGTKELFRIWQVIAILSDMYYEDFFLQFGQFNNALIFFVIETHRASALYHFDQLPIDPITNVCLQQEKWLSGGKTFDMLCLFCQSYELICAWKGWLYVSLWKLLFVFLYHSHFGGLWTTFLQINMSKFNVMNFHHLFYKACT